MNLQAMGLSGLPARKGKKRGRQAGKSKHGVHRDEERELNFSLVNAQSVQANDFF